MGTASEMAYRWETPASVWLEDEVTGQFELASSDGLGRIDWRGHAREHIADSAALLGASLPLSCACASVYPEQFAFCPTCGRALAMLPGAPLATPGWFGPHSDASLPRQVPQGLPATAQPLGAALGQGVPVAAPDAIPVPPNAHSVFAAGGFGFPVERLLALAVARNVLQYWDPQARLWQVLAPDEQAAALAFCASDYGWLPVRHPRRGEVAIVPTDAGLRRLWINPINASYSTDSLFDGTIASAPGQLRQRVACLVVAADGATRLWSAHADLSKQTEADCGGAPASGWSRPIGYDGRLTWLHARGQLTWAGEGAPEWIEWPAGWSPRGRLGGPTKSRDGRLWQLGHHRDDGYSFVELFKAQPETHAVDGARLGFAGLLFRRGHAVVDEPWDVERIEEQHEDDTLVLPLLRGFVDDRKQANGLVLRLHAYTGRAEDVLKGGAIPLVTLEWIGERNLVLDQLRFLKRPQDCVPIVYAGCLWLHHPDWPQLRGWRLAALP
jgi:hypothetical protein